MGLERWKRVRQLFDESVQIDDAERRREFLVRACGSDEELLEEVESLLEHDRSSDSKIGGVVHNAKLDVGAMSLQVGEQLGVFEITEVIDAGGMGEVYRAQDRELEREVAIKVMPDVFASDPKRLVQFEREAKALASLNHPNIASIHGLVKTTEGHALVLEHVDGHTLSDRIAKGPIELDEALALAKQIAEALEAAHEHGIIHCDLKPANIKITPEGVVKVLDFGLARPEQRTSGGSSSETRATVVETESRIVTGTAAYMSPEQAGGEPLDRRTDVWAFGVVLNEMITGRSYFARDTVSDTLAAVLSAEIVLDALPLETPSAAMRLLRRCLQRDRRNRLRDIGDAQFELADAIRERSESPDPVDGPKLRRRRLLWVALGLLAFTAAAMEWLIIQTPPAATLPVNRFHLSTSPGVSILPTPYSDSGSPVAISPDGRMLAFAGSVGHQSQIYLRSLDRLEARSLEGTEGGHAPFFSPDGQWVGFLSGTSTTGDEALKKVPTSGGTPVTISPGHFEGATWGPDDTIVVGTREGLHQVAASGGVPTPLMQLPAPEGHRAPHFLPGGQGVVFYVWGGSPSTLQVEVLSLVTGERRTLVQGSAPRVLSSGHLVFARDDALWAAAFDPVELTLRSDPVRVLEQLNVNVSGVAAYDLTLDGSLIYSPVLGLSRSLVWVDLDGRETFVDVTANLPYAYPRASPDGARISLTVGSGNSDLWVLDLERSVLSRSTLHPSEDSDLEWSPDGQLVAFHSHRNGGGNLYWRASDGTGDIHQVTTGSGEKVVSTWTADSRSLLYWERRPGTGLDIYRVPIDGSPPTALLNSPANEAAAEVSPDGKWLAYASDESGLPEVYVRPFPDVARGKWQVSYGRGWAPVWSPEGKAIYYRQDSKILRVSVETEPRFAVGRPEIVFEGSYVVGRWWDRAYDIAPDGQRFVMLKDTQPESSSDSSSQLVLVQHWGSELETLAPAAP